MNGSMELVLVHGSYHGPWCWDEVRAAFGLRGIGSSAVDLSDAAASTMAGLAALVRGRIGAGRRAILVGHSSGGHVISACAESAPDAVAGLVYVSAVLLGDGRPASDIPRDASERPDRPEAIDDGESRTILRDSPERRRRVRDYFYGRCPPDAAEAAIDRLRPQRMAAFREPVRLSASRFGGVPRLYVKCLADRVIFPSVQQKMIDALPCRAVYPLDADHSPFLSAPGALADVLAEIHATLAGAGVAPREGRGTR